jgi:hypothetical protein
MEHSSDRAIARCRGLFGTLSLFDTHIVMERGHYICDLHEVILRSHPVRRSRIEIDSVTDVGMMASMFLPPLFVIRFPGCSQLSGDPLRDAVLENVHMLSLVDNRPFYDLYERLEAMIADRPSAANGPGKAPPRDAERMA